jgi:phosphoglycolate phosphatase
MSATRDLLFPQTRTVIPTLAKTHRLGIITNSTHAAIDMVLPQELRACFDEIITYEQIALPKPHPSSILELLTRWKMPASECAYVGDAKNDMVFAKNAGVIAVGITTGECTADELREAGADRVVDSLSGLLDI